MNRYTIGMLYRSWGLSGSGTLKYWLCGWYLPASQASGGGQRAVSNLGTLHLLYFPVPSAPTFIYGRLYVLSLLRHHTIFEIFVLMLLLLMLNGCVWSAVSIPETCTLLLFHIAVVMGRSEI